MTDLDIREKYKNVCCEMSSSKEGGHILSGKYSSSKALIWNSVCVYVLAELGFGVAVLHL